jgi:hypothetical protein
VIVTFGAFESYYVIAPLRDKSPSTIAWIGSSSSSSAVVICPVFAGSIPGDPSTGSDVPPVQIFLTIFVVALGGLIFNAEYLLTLLRVGSLLVVLGMMMTVGLLNDSYRTYLRVERDFGVVNIMPVIPVLFRSDNPYVPWDSDIYKVLPTWAPGSGRISIRQSGSVEVWFEAISAGDDDYDTKDQTAKETIKFQTGKVHTEYGYNADYKFVEKPASS